jgi:plastocyanin
MLGPLLRLAVVLVVACGAPATPSATASLGPVRYTTVDASVQPAGSILIEMTNYAFKPADIPLTAGTVVLYLVNPSTLVHVMALRNPAVSILNIVALSDEVAAGHSAVFTIENLPVGVYRVHCPIGNHSDNGMTATATVR